MSKSKDINVKIEEYILNCRVVAIIERDDKILFQKLESDKYWALPGGKIEVGERTIDALSRELEEELGLVNYNIGKMVIMSEHFFEFKKEKYHQFIFGHKVNILVNEKSLDNLEFRGRERKLIFKWFDKRILGEIPIKPDFLRKNLINYSEKNLEFISYIEK